MQMQLLATAENRWTAVAIRYSLLSFGNMRVCYLAMCMARSPTVRNDHTSSAIPLLVHMP